MAASPSSGCAWDFYFIGSCLELQTLCSTWCSRVSAKLQRSMNSWLMYLMLLCTCITMTSAQRTEHKFDRSVVDDSSVDVFLLLPMICAIFSCCIALGANVMRILPCWWRFIRYVLPCCLLGFLMYNPNNWPVVYFTLVANEFLDVLLSGARFYQQMSCRNARRIFQCRFVKGRRFRRCRIYKCRKHVPWVPNFARKVFRMLNALYLALTHEVTTIELDPPFTPPCSGFGCAMYRGGGGGAGGANATYRKRQEKDLLKGLQTLLTQVTATPMPTPSTKGKGKGKVDRKESDGDESAVEYGLLEAIQTLTHRAQKNPHGLLQRLQTVLDVAKDGMLRARKKPTTKAPKQTPSSPTPTAPSKCRKHRIVGKNEVGKSDLRIGGSLPSSEAQKVCVMS